MSRVTLGARILRFDLKGGLLVCAYTESGVGGAGIVVADESTLSLDSVRALVKNVSAAAGTSPVKVKLIGAAPLLRRVMQLFAKEFAKLPLVTKESESKSLEAYFYTDSGRVRLGEATAPVSSPVVTAVQKDRRKRVLIVDDSKTIRQILARILEVELEVVGCAERPSQVEEMIVRLKPDVITLDIHMPEMDGVTLLKKYLPKFQIPTVMISSISMEESSHVLQALEAGAVDYIQKPTLDELAEVTPLIVEKVKTAASAKVKAVTPFSQKAALQKPAAAMGALNHSNLIAIGSSTGGTEALREVLTRLPSGIPPIVIVQHIPAVFSLAFAKRMNDLCAFEVKEAADGDECRPNRVLIAPGGFQMSLVRGSGPSGYQVQVKDAPPVNRHRPSVDVLFQSVADLVGKKAVGVILTGMGADGAKGMLQMRQRGARTIAQDEASCVVFGMPQAAIKLKAAEQVRPLVDIAGEILTLVSSKAA